MQTARNRRGGVSRVRLGRASDAAAIELLESRRLLSTVTWTGAAGDNSWTNANNWTDGAVAREPTASDDVSIATGASPIVNVAGSINSLTTGTPLSVVGNTLMVSNGITLNDAALTLGSASSSNPGLLIFTGGSQTIGGHGEVVFAGNSQDQVINQTSNAAGTTLTIGAGITLHGNSASIDNQFGTQTLINQGTISADVSGGQVTVDSSNIGIVNNTGTITAANGAMLSLNGNWNNQGKLLEDGSTLNLGGNFTTAEIGRLLRTDGNVNLVGSLDNTAATLALTAATGSWTLTSSAQIISGVVSESGGAQLTIADGTLDGVTLANDLTVAESDSLYVQDGLTLSNGATLTLGSAADNTSGSLVFRGGASQALGGMGSLVFAHTNGTNGGLVLNGPMAPGPALTLTIGPGITVRGAYGTFENGFANDSLVNQGTIQADVPDGILNLPSVGTWSNSGTMTASAGTLNLNGSFTTAGMGRISNTGGTVNLAGTLHNTGAAFDLDATTGSWNLTGFMNSVGTIIGGTVAESGGASLNVIDGALEGVTLAGSLDVGANDYLTVRDDLILNGGATITVDDGTGVGGGLVFDGPAETVSGAGSIVLGGIGSGSIWNQINVSGPPATLTIGPKVAIHGKGAIANFNYATLINQGTIAADVAGGTLTMSDAGNANVGSDINAPGGTWSVINGATLNLFAPWSNAGALVENNSTLNLGGSFTTADVAGFNRTGGTVNLRGAMNNAGATFAVNASTGSWNFSGRISGGTLTEADGAILSCNSGELSGVTLGGPINLDENRRLYVDNGLSLIDGAVITVGSAIDNSNGAIVFGGPSEILGGYGSILFAGNGANALYDLTGNAYTATSLTIGPDILIHGQNGSLNYGSYSSTTLINEGTISADVSGGRLSLLRYGAFTNMGTLSATGGGTINVQLTPTNFDAATHTLSGGTWSVGAGSTLAFPTGTSIQTNAATINVSGNGAFPALAGLATNDGTLSLTNRSLTANPSGGTFTNAGTLLMDPNSTLAVIGAFAQTAAGTLSVGIDGATASSGFGQVSASGTAALDGTLDATIGGGYDPSGGTAFPIVAGAARSGTFAAFNGTPTPSGLPLAVAYDATTAKVIVQSLPIGAAFVRADGLTEGTWTGAYGADGYALFGGASSLPSYATLSVSNASQWTWDPSPSDPRAPQTAPGSASRLAACDYSATTFGIDLNLTDGKSHAVSLYALNWDSWANRDETIQLTDAATGNLLDSRSIGGFGGGTWLTWNVSGHVQISVINHGGLNAVLSGIFFGPPTTAPAASVSFVRADATTGGTWTGTYGADGRSIFGGSTSLPSYAQLSMTGQQTYVWQQPSDSDARTLQAAPGSSSRLAACDFSASSFSFDLNLTDGKPHVVSLYALNYDSWSTRAQTIQVIDAGSGTVLDSRNVSGFGGGVWLSWNLTGHVRINVTNDGGLNAVASGIFFDPPLVSSSATASFVRGDSATQGSWTGAYGADGFEVVNADANIPAYATLNVPASLANYTWASATSDPRALQIAPGALSRIAACYYSNSPGFSFNLSLTDGKTHQVALYLLDYDYRNRAETIQISDVSTGAVLDTQSVSDFSQGKYLVWNLSGSLNVTLANSGGLNEVLSGIFFG